MGWKIWGIILPALCVGVIDEMVYILRMIYIYLVFSSSNHSFPFSFVSVIFLLFIQLLFSEYCSIMSYLIFYSIGQTFSYLQTLHFSIILFNFFKEFVTAWNHLIRFFATLSISLSSSVSFLRKRNSMCCSVLIFPDLGACLVSSVDSKC